MPQRDMLGKAAETYLEALDDENDARKTREKAAEELSKLMKEKGKDSIVVDGRTISLRYKEAVEALVVKKNKEVF